MRVLHLTTEFPPVIYGGLGTAVGGLVAASAAAGMEIGVLLVGPAAGDPYGRFVPSPRSRTGATRRSGEGATIFEVSFDDLETMVRAAARWRPDVLHLHSFWLWRVAEALRRRLGTPLVYTVHSLDRAEYELGQAPPECLTQWTGQEAVIEGADRVIALARSERELLKVYCPGAGSRVRVVGNGIEDTTAAPRARTGSAGPPVVLFSGRFVERKGVHELVEAMGVVLVENPEVRFVLAGGHRHCTGADMEAWLLPARLHRHRARIRFTGWQTPEEMRGWYRAADILAVPSWYEPFGMVVLEGMLHGLAVAASAVGGPAEILEHGRTGLLFPPRDAGALAGAIRRLAADPDHRLRLGAAAADEVRRRWLWPRVIEKMRAVYDELVPLQAAQRRHAKASYRPSIAAPVPALQV